MKSQLLLEKMNEILDLQRHKDFENAAQKLHEEYLLAIRLKEEVEESSNYDNSTLKELDLLLIQKEIIAIPRKIKMNEIFWEGHMMSKGEKEGGTERMLYIFLKNREVMDEMDDLTKKWLSYCLESMVEAGKAYDCFTLTNYYGVIPKANNGADCYNLTKKIEFLRLCMKQWEGDSIDYRKRIGNEAIMYYYLGGAAFCFLQFDDVIDCMEEAMSPKELYYYCLTSKIIAKDFDEISNDAIRRIKSDDDVSKYYKGQIYLLKGDKTQALELFKQSQIFRYSYIMMNYLNDGKENYHTPDVCSFDPTQQSYDIFEDFHFYHECLISFRGYETPSNIYNFFKVDKDAIENRVKMQEAEMLTEHLYTDLNNRTIPLSDEEYQKRIVLLDDLLGTKDPKVRRAFYETNQGIKDFPHKAEIQIGLTIENFEISDINFYAILIYNYYFRQIIDQEAVINLSSYVMAVAKRKMTKEVFDKLFNVGLAATTVTALAVLCPFDYLNPFKQLCMAPPLVLIMSQLGSNKVNPMDESLYEKFKKELKIQRLELKKALGDNDFSVQCRFSTIIDKIHRFDDFIKNLA